MLGTKCAISLTHIRKSLTNPNSRWAIGWNKGEKEQKMLQKKQQWKNRIYTISRINVVRAMLMEQAMKKIRA